MIRQYGEDAAHQIDARARALIERSDSAAGLVWRRIREAIDQLKNDKPNGPAHQTTQPHAPPLALRLRRYHILRLTAAAHRYVP